MTVNYITISLKQKLLKINTTELLLDSLCRLELIGDTEENDEDEFILLELKFILSNI